MRACHSIPSRTQTARALVAHVQAYDLRLYCEWFINADIKADFRLSRETGIFRRLLRPTGLLLFHIDPRPLRADMDQAQEPAAQSQGPLTRSDLFNLVDHPIFGSPSNNVGSPQFGLIDSDAGSIAGKWRLNWRPQSACQIG